MFMSGEDEAETGIGSAAAGRILSEFRQIFLRSGGNPPHAELESFYQERESDLKGGFVYAGVMLAWMDYSGYGTVVSEKAAREHLRQSAKLRGSLSPDLVIRMVTAFDPGFIADTPANLSYSKRYLRLGLFLTLLPQTPAGNYEIAKFLLSLVLDFNDSEVARKRAVELIESAAEKDPTLSVEAARALFVNDLPRGLTALTRSRAGAAGRLICSGASYSRSMTGAAPSQSPREADARLLLRALVHHLDASRPPP